MTDRTETKRLALSGTPLFGSLDAEAINHLATLARWEALPAKTILFRKGDLGETLYVVISGLIQISATSADGRDVTFNIMGAGSLFGEVAVLDGRHRTADATAVEPTELVALDRRDLIPFLERHPTLAIRMLASCSERLRWVSGLLEDSYFLELPGRLAKRLVLLAQSFGQENEAGVAIGIRLSQRDLASQMNAARESVNKVLRIWERDGLIRLDKGRIIITKLDSLSALYPSELGRV